MGSAKSGSLEQAPTGEAFWDLGRQAMPGKLLRAYTGTEFVFSS